MIKINIYICIKKVGEVVIEEKYVEKWIFTYSRNDFFCTEKMWKKRSFAQRLLIKRKSPFVHNSLFHYPQGIVEKLQTRIDICGNIPDVILQVFITGF